jgi:XRE family aerobic/anaerobic benzoate catabolism transcriptional regulator
MAAHTSRKAKTERKAPPNKSADATPRDRLLSALGSVVRAQRGRLGQSRQALSKRAALSERFLAQLESGHGNISVAKLDELARALNVPSAALLIAASRAAAAPASSLAIEKRAIEILAGITVQLEQGPPELLDAVSKYLGDRRSNGGSERPELIALLGLRGAGKSTLGPLLAGRLSLAFHEMDDLIAEESGLALSDIFALHGESYYREAERRALRGLIDRREPAIVAVSGGIVTDPEAFDLLKRHTLMVWLHTRPENYMARVEAQGDYRPMRNRPNAMAELKALLTERTPLYRQAHVALDTARLEAGAAAERLAVLIEEANSRLDN